MPEPYESPLCYVDLESAERAGVLQEWNDFQEGRITSDQFDSLLMQRWTNDGSGRWLDALRKR